jgi:hypothetical protein
MLWNEDNYDSRWQFVENIQNWFRKNDRFWLSLSSLSFIALLVLEIILIFATQLNHSARNGADFLVIPLLGLYSFTIFWRSIEQSFLIFAGVIMVYFLFTYQTYRMIFQSME